MGFGLTLRNFMSHLMTEPAVALGSFSYSIKDIAEMLYFYFTELSLTACYVILFILTVRLLLKKAPKEYSYPLWAIVYFKLVSSFTVKIPEFKSFIPQYKIDEIYTTVTPQYSAFYSTEAGFVSIVDSEMITPAALTSVSPWYIPALIWFIVLIIVLCISFGAFINVVCRNIGCKEKLQDNVYLCDNIAVPFVFGIFRPKIYLPKGLTEQDQNYVINHEKVHIKHWDHIWKLVAFVITCIHWFNPLVWLSFFLMEKDMEMRCDEKVVQNLGNEHKKDYSRCILSLAANRRFIPKAYLSFGDSDTKKRVKNVLNYKKPSFWAGILLSLVTVIVTIGMYTKNDIVVPPVTDTPVAENFAPSGYDRFYFTLDGNSTDISLVLPEGWTFESRNINVGEEPPYLSLDDNFSDVYDIFDDKRNNVGAFGFVSYNEQLGAENNLMAIYGAVALPNMYHFDVTENYTAVNKDDSGMWESAVTKVYHSPSLVHNNGGLGDAVYGDGILSYSRECSDFIAIEFEENLFSADELNLIAKSIQIEPAQASYSIGSTLLYTLYRNIDTGSNFDISKYVSEDVYKLLNAKTEIAKHRLQVFGNDKQSYDVTVIPFEKEKWIEDEKSAQIKLQVLRTWRYNTANFDSSDSDVVTLRLDRNSAGDFVVTEYRIDGKDTTFANMDIDYWNAVQNGNGNEFLKEFVSEYKNFISNSSSALSFEQIYNLTDTEYNKLKRSGYWLLINEAGADGNQQHIKNIIDMFLNDKTEEEIRDFAKAELIKNGVSDSTIKSLANRSWHPITVYCMNDARLYMAVNRIKQHDFFVSCAEASAENSYIITYCDNRFIPIGDAATLHNPNGFAIVVHLLSEGNTEHVFDLGTGESAVFGELEKETEYTIGLHAFVAVDTEIKFTIYESL